MMIRIVDLFVHRSSFIVCARVTSGLTIGFISSCSTSSASVHRSIHSLSALTLERMRSVLLCLLLACSSPPPTTATTEHWFMFDRYQFPGFYTPLFTLISTAPNRTFDLSFSLDAYGHSILVEVRTGNLTAIGAERDTPIKLNVERADLIDQSAYQVIFIAVRAGLVLESYVDCKRMDSHVLKSLNETDEELDFTFQVYRITDQIEHRPIQSANQSELDEFFAAGPCRPAPSASSTANGTTATIDQPLIVKMQGIIDRIRQQTK